MIEEVYEKMNDGYSKYIEQVYKNNEACIQKAFIDDGKVIWNEFYQSFLSKLKETINDIKNISCYLLHRETSFSDTERDNECDRVKNYLLKDFICKINQSISDKKELFKSNYRHSVTICFKDLECMKQVADEAIAKNIKFTPEPISVLFIEFREAFNNIINNGENPVPIDDKDFQYLFDKVCHRIICEKCSMVKARLEGYNIELSRYFNSIFTNFEKL